MLECITFKESQKRSYSLHDTDASLFDMLKQFQAKCLFQKTSGFKRHMNSEKLISRKLALKSLYLCTNWKASARVEFWLKVTMQLQQLYIWRTVTVLFGNGQIGPNLFGTRLFANGHIGPNLLGTRLFGNRQIGYFLMCHRLFGNRKVTEINSSACGGIRYR